MESELRERFDVVSVEYAIGGQTLRLLRPRDADVLLDEEEFEHDDRLPYWAELWPSARVLAERLVSEPGRGRRLLELGCGVGLCSLAAARAGYDVLATDYYREACQFAAVNAEANGLRLQTRLVDWRELPDDLGQFDVIVGADVLYERPYSALIASVIDRLLAPQGYVLVSDPHRSAAEPFPAECARLGLQVAAAEQIPIEHEAKTFTIDLFTLRRRV